MKRVNLILVLLFYSTLSIKPSFADENETWTVSSLMQSLGGTKTYTNDDGSYVYINMHYYTPSFEYMMSSYDPATKETVYHTGWERTNMTVNGVYIPGSSATPAIYHQTFDFDENGRLQAIYAPNWGDNHGQLLQTFKYAEDGQMLVYNPQGELVGAYNGWLDKMVDSTGVYQQNLNHLDAQGNYTSTDQNGNVVAVYKASGGFNSYKYDAGGNLVGVYEDGKQTYARRSYTVEEATKAVQKGVKNTFSIKYR